MAQHGPKCVQFWLSSPQTNNGLYPRLCGAKSKFKSTLPVATPHHFVVFTPRKCPKGCSDLYWANLAPASSKLEPKTIGANIDPLGPPRANESLFFQKMILHHFGRQGNCFEAIYGLPSGQSNDPTPSAIEQGHAALACAVLLC